MDNINENYNKKEGKLQNYVIFPRQLASDYRNRVITLDELSIHNWLRLNANLYGSSTTSLSDLSNDLFRGRKSENYINKLILSLKRKRYIYYKSRSGCRGSFEVKFGDFRLPTGVVTSLDKYFNITEVRGEIVDEAVQKSEPIQNLPNASQRINDIRKDISSIVSTFSKGVQVRASNNDKDNYKEKDLSSSFKVETNLSEFKPKNLDEQYCLTLAEKLEEKNMGFILSSLKKYGRETLEKAWRDFQEQEQKTKIINRGAYFNSLVKKTYDLGN